MREPGTFFDGTILLVFCGITRARLSWRDSPSSVALAGCGSRVRAQFDGRSRRSGYPRPEATFAFRAPAGHGGVGAAGGMSEASPFVEHEEYAEHHAGKTRGV